MRPTPAGRVFLTEARRHLRRSELTALAACQVHEGEAGSLAVGFTAAAAHSVLDRLLKVVPHVVPAVEGVLRELVTRDQLQALAESSLDLGIVRLPVSSPELSSQTVAREPFVAAPPAAHQLAARQDSVHIREFDGTYLMYAPAEARCPQIPESAFWLRSQTRPNTTTSPGCRQLISVGQIAGDLRPKCCGWASTGARSGPLSARVTGF
ncbi:LysR substrate-binding domain-containing protein [Streptomyces sp. NBC_01361]|uniref:LysR substrate-binding domain-containing protein n=1 Tax=Streptomyces sp. NBC_01361 TaxID=2903838 RepID=UPI002E37D51A|nr:LysR substrate-binding domain-containing protein [Streptomyces sp. NBC_01361]